MNVLFELVIERVIRASDSIQTFHRVGCCSTTTAKFKNDILPTFREKCINEVVGIRSIYNPSFI